MMSGRRLVRALVGRPPGPLVLALMLWLAVVGCGAAPEAPPPATTQARIISLVPAVTEMLFAIGAGPDVVGVSSFDRFPAEVEALPKVGALVDPDFERILTLHPTLVVVYGTQSDLIARLDGASIPTFTYQHAVDQGLDDIPQMIRRLGVALDRIAQAEVVAAGIERDLDSIREEVAGQPRPATALLFGREPGTLRGIYASAGVGFLHDVLELAGGRDVFGDIARESLQVSTETLLARQPEVILELRPSLTTPAAVAAEVAVWNQLAAIPAVRDGRVRILTDPGLTVPGPRIAETARAFREVLRFNR